MDIKCIYIKQLFVELWFIVYLLYIIFVWMNEHLAKMNFEVALSLYLNSFD